MNRFRSTLLSLILAALPLSTNLPALAQSSSRPHRGPVQAKDYEQFAVYWSAEAGWKTELLLRNNLAAQSLTVTPALRTADGTETALPAVTINSNDVATVDLGAVIASAAPQLAGAYGSIVFRYTAPVIRALYAAVMVELPGTPIEFHLDGFFQATAPVPGGREGIWWLPRDSVKDWLVLANTSANSLAATLMFYDASGKAWKQSVTLNARQMTRLSVRSLLQQAGLTGLFGGIKIDIPNGAGYLDSAHFVYDDANGTLALMKMFDHDPSATLIQRSLTDKQWTIRAPMLALTNPDPALALPAGTILQPAIFLRNVSGNSYTAQLTFNWRSDSTTGKSTSAVAMRPYATTMVDVAALQANGTIPAAARWAYVSITAPVQPDNLLAVATSFDATGRLGAQTPFSDQVANHWEGGKWEVDANHNTIIAVGNAGTTASKAQITFYYNSGQGKYQVEQTLAPDQQLWLDMGKLIGNQVSDKNGKTIPTDVMSGTYELRSLTNLPTEGLFEGKLVVDKTYGYAAHGCMDCCGYGPPHMDINPLNLTVGGSGYQWAWAWDPCDGGDADVTGYFGSWWTGNTQIATANMNQISGVAAGSTTNSASGYVPAIGGGGTQCPNALRQPSGPVNVVPTVTISGSTNVPMLASGAQGSDSVTLTANPNPSGGTYSWTILSGSSNINLLNYTSQSAIVQSKAVGTFTVQVAYTLNNQTGTAVAVGKVQQPASLSVPAGGDTGFVYDFDCRNTAPDYPPYTAGTRRITYQVLDTAGQPIPAAGMSAAESFSPGSSSCVDTGYPSATTTATFSDGTFGPDTLGHLCSISCLPADSSDHPLGSCSLAVQQTWSVNGYSAQTKTVTYTCQSVTLQ